MSADIPAGVAAGALSDDELLGAARRGDAAALETLLVRYQPHLYRFGLRMCGNVDDAGDVAQESLMSMARSVRDFRGDSSVSSWLYTIARRFCIKKRRRSKFAPAHEESLDAPATGAAQHLADPRPNPEQTATNRELATALTHAIDALEPSQREVLVLRDVEGLSAPEVAGILGMSVDAVKSRLHRARVAMRAELAPVLGRPAITPARRSVVPGCPDTLLATPRRRDRSERVRDDGGTSRAVPSLPRRLRVAEAGPGDLPTVADAGRAPILGRVRQSCHPRLPRPALAKPHAHWRRPWGFSPVCELPPVTRLTVSCAILAICPRRPSERELHNPSSGSQRVSRERYVGDDEEPSGSATVGTHDWEDKYAGASTSISRQGGWSNHRRCRIDGGTVDRASVGVAG